MRPRTQKQPQVKKELCRVLDYVNVKMKCSVVNLKFCFTDYGTKKFVINCVPHM